jgi:voltage-gated potassium channel
VTTVGYGDRFPVTPEGRAIAVGLMIAGVGLFGALSGVVASLLLGQRGQENEVLAEIRALRAQVDQLARE